MDPHGAVFRQVVDDRVVHEVRSEHVEVFRMVSVRTSILGDLDPYPDTNRAPLDHTLNYEKPVFALRNRPGSGILRGPIRTSAPGASSTRR
ncbi:hypothetical protein GCM10023152_29800 [Agromyces bauzanensis]|uniref:Uncharacterized protein n=1 Tax=Agromyces bauzanensis TaxID=1308924 RepID=A0A917PW38_9MICO|nr:hypothetical protein GCM10011372_35850 [Agromyces bauzanensis]